MDKIVEIYSNYWDNEVIEFRLGRGKFRIGIKLLSEYNQMLLELNNCESHSIYGITYLRNGKLLANDMALEVRASDKPIQLSKVKTEPFDYITYNYNKGRSFINVQRNGFLVYCAPTGQGKTHFALSNLISLSKQCDTVMYLNFELSIQDIKGRVESMGLEVPDNVYIAPMDSVRNIEKWSNGRGRIIFIVDNIDNLVGGGIDPYGEQLEFIKQLDRFLKDNNHHALVLTQIVKDTNMDLLGKDGLISPKISTNILSGVKQLSYLSRTVMMTAYSPSLNDNNGDYDYKILKMGSAKFV